MIQERPMDTMGEEERFARMEEAEKNKRWEILQNHALRAQMEDSQSIPAAWYLLIATIELAAAKLPHDEEVQAAVGASRRVRLLAHNLAATTAEQ